MLFLENVTFHKFFDIALKVDGCHFFTRLIFIYTPLTAFSKSW